MANNRLFSGRRRLSTDEAALRVFETLDTPVSLSCYILLKNKMYRELIMKDVDALDYAWFPDFENHQESKRIVAEKFGRDYQAVKLLSKLDREIGIDKEAAARTTWRGAEDRNRQTNARFRAHYSATVVDGNPSPLLPFTELLHRARKIVASVLGDFRWSDAAGSFDFGPGVSRQTRGRSVDLSRKYAGTPAISPLAFAEAAVAIGLTPVWFEALAGFKPDGPCSYLGIVADDAASLTFVPKNAKTLRAIGIEPLMGVYLQKGIGAIIRKRLKRRGINLDSQEKNQAGAFLASLLNGYATLDLSSASDTVSIAIVEELLPSDWFDVLSRLRSRYTEVDGAKLWNEKFSSMGNGFTFELESLIFYALSQACEDLNGTSHEVLVYGDDIIVHENTAKTLIPLLEACGFKLNEAKSFVNGYFYESCGRDFFMGYDVRPFFIKKELEDIEDYFKFYNQCGRVHRNRDVPYRTFLYGGLLGCVYFSVRPRYRFVVPIHFGDDTGFQRFFDEACPSLYRRDGWSVFRFAYWKPVPVGVYRFHWSVLAAKLSRDSAVRDDPFFEDISPPRTGNLMSVRRDRYKRRRVGVGYTHTWL